MAQVITFEDYRPIARYDGLAWTQARIEESDTDTLSATTVWAELETKTISPLDADPTNPAYRSFTTELASDTDDLWYRIVFVDASGDESLPTTPVQNSDTRVDLYASVTELARILKIRAPTAEQETAMERVLLAAAGEINSEIDVDADTELTGWQLALAAEVNLERAVEHWRQQEAPFGLVETTLGTSFTARDSWERHANKLAPLKGQWGFA